MTICSNWRTSDIGRFYKISVPYEDIIIALVLCFAFFLVPAIIHLWIKYFFKDSLLDMVNKETIDWKTAVPVEKPPSCFLACHDLHYSVPMNREFIKKTGKKKGSQLDILKGVSAVFHPGTMTAIMGPSGCGKSTLLDVLADRKQRGTITGTVSVNGFARDKYFKRASAYVLQFDALFPYLTVQETFLFAAELRLDGTNLEKLARVTQVIQQLDLGAVADTIVGDDSGPKSRGVSGGQRRRVSVGIELLTSPSLMFLDEPTTGLDAFDSLTLIRLMRQLANRGCTIICTIHQPRCEIFNLFDCLLLMVSGELAYSGELSGLHDFMEGAGLPIPHGANVGDFIVDLTYAKGDDASDTPHRLLNHYSQSDLKQRNEAIVSRVVHRDLEDGRLSNVSEYYHKDLNTYKGSSCGLYYASSIRRQFIALSQRSSINNSRNRRNIYIRLAINSAQILFFGLLWLGLRVEKVPLYMLGFAKDNAINRSIGGFLYTMINAVCIFEVDIIVSVFNEKRVFHKEHASGAYSVVAYHLFLATNLGWRALKNGVIYSLIVYFLSGLSITAPQFFTFVLFLALLSSCGSGIALVLVTAIPDIRGAADIHNSILGFMGTFAGYFLVPPKIPWFLKFYSYHITFYKFAYEGLLWNEYSHGHGDFHQTSAILGNSFSVDCKFNVWTNLMILLIYPILFHIVATAFTFLHTRPRSFWNSFKSSH